MSYTQTPLTVKKPSKQSYDIIGRYKCFKASQKTGCERAFKMPSIQEQVCRLTPPTSLVFLPIDATVWGFI